MPPELLAFVTLQMTLRDKISFGATCHRHRVITNGSLLHAAALSLEPYNLSLANLRFLQSATQTYISGSTITRILYAGSNIGRLSTPAIPRTLDLYCPRNEGLDIGFFLSRATNRVLNFYTGDYNAGDSIRRAFSLTKTNAPDIRLFETFSNNPLEAILHLPTTAEIGAWTVDRLWHAYPKATLAGSAITSPSRMPTHDVQSRQKSWDKIHANLQNDIRIETQWPWTHECARDVNCPITWRTARDIGCLTIKFPTLPWTTTQGAEEQTWEMSNVSWTLGAIAPCIIKTCKHPKRTDISYRNHEREQYSQAFQFIRPTIPREGVDSRNAQIDATAGATNPIDTSRGYFIPHNGKLKQRLTPRPRR